ncbi:MAG: hypothetical protein KME57_11225 [Scytonema hyalinum WJT4-NPBG1]|nr:hypothetical protein [Scytonema hyalinum WJT4-NPBG1]
MARSARQRRSHLTYNSNPNAVAVCFEVMYDAKPPCVYVHFETHSALSN